MLSKIKSFIKQSNNLFKKRKQLEKKIEKTKSAEKKIQLQNELKQLDKQIKTELLQDKTNKDVAQVILYFEKNIDTSNPGLVALDSNAYSYFASKLRRN
jgi:predicted transcriptional regulator